MSIDPSTQTARPQPVSNRPTREAELALAVPISRDLLAKLHRHQNALDRAVTSYFILGKLVVLCDEIRSDLEEGIRGAYKIDESRFWRKLRKDLENVEVLGAELRRAIPKTFVGLVTEFEKALKEAKGYVSRPLKAPSGAQVKECVEEIYRSVEVMSESLTKLATNDRLETESVLKDISACVTTIFQAVKVADKVAKEPRSMAAKLSRFGESLQRGKGASEDQISAPPVGSRAPAYDTIQKAVQSAEEKWREGA